MNGCEREPVAIVLAAGRGSRMGGPKALMMVGGRAWWRVQRERLHAAGVRDVWVVSPEVRESMRREREAPEVIVTGEPSAPMFASIVAGIVALRDEGLGGVFLLPVDVPGASEAVWSALARCDRVCVPRCGDRRGHPAWLPWSFVERVILPRAGDAAWIMETRLDQLIAEDVVEVEVQDAGVVVNLNEPGDVEGWIGRVGGE